MNKPDDLRQTDGKVKTTVHFNPSVFTWAQENMVEQGYDKLSEYFSHLVRQDRKTLLASRSYEEKRSIIEQEADIAAQQAEPTSSKGRQIRNRILEKRDQVLRRKK